MDPTLIGATQRLTMHRWLLMSRTIETTCGRLSPRWFPAEGEEAVMVGAFSGLRSNDFIAPHYRGPYVTYLMRGADLVRLLAAALGKSASYSRGRGMAFMGPPDRSIIPWVAGDLGTTIGVATGAALAASYTASERVAVCSFGDGTASRGDFHEALNLAAVWRLPIVYVCQNNGFAISVPYGKQTAAARIASRAAGYGMPGVEVDGADVAAVFEAVQDAVRRARQGEGPTLIEAHCVRLRGHWEADGQEYRAGLVADTAQYRDPLAVSAAALLTAGVVAEIDLRRMAAEVEEEVARALEEAQALPDLDEEGVGEDGVYANSPADYVR